jgi:hypothetical protein
MSDIGGETIPEFKAPDYNYGNHSPIEVIKLRPNLRDALDPHASLEKQALQKFELLFTEVQLEEKIEELVRNYGIQGDPGSPEKSPREFGMTILNEHLLSEGKGAILVLTTEASNLFDHQMNPNTAGLAVELGIMALVRDQPILLVESPGTGNSTDFDEDEQRQAAQNGRLIYVTGQDSDGRITDYETFETIKAIVRTIKSTGVPISHISANAWGAHLGSGVAAELEAGTLEASFLYNPTNISDRNPAAFILASLLEIWQQNKYEERSNDPLRLTPDRLTMARRIMSSRGGNIQLRKIDQARAQTHDPRKLLWRKLMTSKGHKSGKSAAVHVVSAQMRHPNLNQTCVLPEFAAHYKGPEDFVRFMGDIALLGGLIREVEDLESLKLPMGQYGHTHYPTVRQTLESYAFNR